MSGIARRDIRAICNNKFYAKKLANIYLLSLYYLVS